MPSDGTTASLLLLLLTLLLLLSGCGPEPGMGDCEIDIDPRSIIKDGAEQHDSGDSNNDGCQVQDPATRLYDYTACCPNGYSPIGLNAEGEVICWCGE